MQSMVKIIAIDKDGNREEITDLYWFEENFVHSFDDDKYTFEIYIHGVKVHPAK